MILQGIRLIDAVATGKKSFLPGRRVADERKGFARPDLMEGILEDWVAVLDGEGGNCPVRRPELLRFFREKRERSGMLAVVDLGAGGCSWNAGKQCDWESMKVMMGYVCI